MKAIVAKAEKDRNFFIDSAGILDYHEGELPDSRMRQAALERGYVLDTPSRPVKKSDFERFDYIIAMDRSVLNSLQRMPSAESKKSKILLMSDFLTKGKYNYSGIPDPYYGNKSDFDLVIDLLEDALPNFLKTIVPNKNE
jgi:protein-tyrosine phosphatase